MRDITETHPGLVKILANNLSYRHGIKLTLTFKDIQKHTIDKAVLKKVIKKLAKEELLESIDWEKELFKELGLED
jgi:arsenate reductase-like glutaredoxin family protein